MFPWVPATSFVGCLLQQSGVSVALFWEIILKVFLEMGWGDGINVNDERLNHLYLADELVLIANNACGIKEILQTLNA